MPTIKVRKQADGSTRYTAIVRLRSGKTIVHQEAEDIHASLRGRELGQAPRGGARESRRHSRCVQQGAPTLAELIRWYIDTFETISKWQRSKQTHLEFLERHRARQN